MHAGLPCDEYCFGGRYFRSEFVLDGDQLTECTGILLAYTL